MKRRVLKFVSITLPMICFIALSTLCAHAEDDSGISVTINGTDGTNGSAQSLQILFLLTILSLAPSIILMMTSFTRISIVFSFVRSGLGTQQTPPNQVLIGLALFLSLFIMSPVISQINTNAYEPYSAGTITQQQAIDEAMKPLRTFMLKQTNKEEMKLFMSFSGKDTVENYDDIPNTALIPAFILSELKKAFIMGFMILIPFLIIDMVVASTLMSMGMIMVPPSMISLPFKLILFVVVDGWDLVVKTLVTSFST
ncbi:MAG: flagellar type III secretion system pore protein FliP [Oscillospiraceae bacterium]|nr:flagellar type III secretion system pore protein FliP [Oscillospiraceae bacterium]